MLHRFWIVIVLGGGLFGCEAAMKWANTGPNGTPTCRSNDPKCSHEFTPTNGPSLAQCKAGGASDMQTRVTCKEMIDKDERDQKAAIEYPKQQRAERLRNARWAADGARSEEPKDFFVLREAQAALVDVKDPDEKTVKEIEEHAQKAVQRVKQAKEERAAYQKSEAADYAQAQKGMQAKFDGAEKSCSADFTKCENACKNGHDEFICSALGKAYAIGLVGAKQGDVNVKPTNAGKAHEFLDPICFANRQGIACRILENVLKQADRCAQNQACDLLCGNGFAISCTRMGESKTSQFSSPEDIKDSFRWFKKACDLGEPIACNEVGRSYFWGRGVGKDVATAESYFKKSCDGGNKDGCEDSHGLACYTKTHTPAQLSPKYDRYCPRGSSAYRGTAKDNGDGCAPYIAALGCGIQPAHEGEDYFVYCCR